MVKIGNPRRWLAVAAFTLAVCAFSFAQPEKADKHKGGDDGSCHPGKCQPVPDGGSAAGYLLAAGAVCSGALWIHSRRKKSLAA